MDKQNYIKLLISEYDSCKQQLFHLEKLILLLGGKITESEKVVNKDEFSSKNNDYSNYNPSEIWSWKVKYALHKLGGSGYATDLISVIEQEEPELDKQAIYNGITQNASILSRKGEINSKNHGRKKLYMI